MEQRKLHSIQHMAAIILTTMSVLFSACNSGKNNYSFKTPQDALNMCHKELSRVKNLNKADIKQLSSIIDNWLVLQDSALGCFMRDSTVKYNIEISADFFAVADSFRTEVTRLALAEPRSLKDVVTMKIATAHNRKKITASKTYLDAVAFYDKMDETTIYSDKEQTLTEYESLLMNADPFRKEQQLHQFLQQEDRCFRSLMAYLKDIPQERLQVITDKTSQLFDELYKNTTADLENEVNERVMIYLTMRFNRRIMQNAEVCRKEVKNRIKLNAQQADNYRWMMIQPFMTIDNYAMAVLTDQQIAQMENLADELPELLTYVDGIDTEKGSKEDKAKLESVLSEYFIKTYIKSIL